MSGNPSQGLLIDGTDPKTEAGNPTKLLFIWQLRKSELTASCSEHRVSSVTQVSHVNCKVFSSRLSPLKATMATYNDLAWVMSRRKTTARVAIRAMVLL